MTPYTIKINAFSFSIANENEMQYNIYQIIIIRYTHRCINSYIRDHILLLMCQELVVINASKMLITGVNRTKCI